MPKLTDVINDERFLPAQKARIWNKVKEYSPEGKPKLDIAKDCLNQLWQIYDSGGISVGRSMRACLQEEAWELIEVNLLEEAKELLAILVAMYHSPEYINQNKWYDNMPIDSMSELPLNDRTFLIPAVLALGVEDIPDISLCTLEHIGTLLDEAEEKRRNLRKGS